MYRSGGDSLRFSCFVVLLSINFCPASSDQTDFEFAASERVLFYFGLELNLYYLLEESDYKLLTGYIRTYSCYCQLSQIVYNFPNRPAILDFFETFILWISSIVCRMVLSLKKTKNRNIKLIREYEDKTQELENSLYHNHKFGMLKDL